MGNCLFERLGVFMFGNGGHRNAIQMSYIVMSLRGQKEIPSDTSCFLGPARNGATAVKDLMDKKGSI